jgi:hypothetical protein
MGLDLQQNKKVDRFDGTKKSSLKKNLLGTGAISLMKKISFKWREMMFHLTYAVAAQKKLFELEKKHDEDHHYRAICKVLHWMKTDLHHPSLHTHKIRGSQEEIFETYAENHTPGAYRIFWRYGEDRGTLCILSIEHHP